MLHPSNAGPLTAIVLLGWLPAIVLLFSILPSRRAAIIGFIGAWLFLPVAMFNMPGLPVYNKMTATSLGILIGTLIFDGDRIMSYKPKWPDIFALIFCLCAIPTSVLNGLGVYDGFSAAFISTFSWGLPYFIGRLYFSDIQGLRELAIGVVIGGIVYIPLCMLEAWISPQLHRIVYGFQPASFMQVRRWGGWRPNVFMKHGLMLGMWMAGTTLVAYWLWITGAVRRLVGVQMSILVLALVITTVLCKSTGAIIIMVFGIAVFTVTKYSPKALWLWMVILIPVFYVVIRGSGMWSGQELVDAAGVLGDERATSLEFRLHNENLLSGKARQRPIFGWGAWGRNRVYDEAGRDLTTTDGEWIITFGQKGLVGLISQMAILLVPGMILSSRIPSRLWARPEVAPAVALAFVVALWMIDNLFNAMFNPVFVLMAGGVAGLGWVQIAQPKRAHRRTAPRRRRATYAS